MSVTPLLGAPVLAFGESPPETSVNLIARYLEAFATRIIIVDRDLTAAPTLVDGEAYLVAGAPGGGDPWNGQSGKIALAINTSWVFVTVRDGLEIEVLDEDATFVRRGGAWVTVSGSGGNQVVTVLVTDPNGSAITTGDGKAYYRVPSTLNGLNLIAVAAALTTTSSSGTPTIQCHNATQAADMLSTRITIDVGETDSKDASAAAVIDTGNDDVATGDMLRIDVDVAGTGAKGLIVELQFG